MDFIVRALIVAYIIALSTACVRAQVASDERETRVISGWQVHIAKKLLNSEADDTAKALAGLKKMLDEIVRDLPADAVAHLKKVPLYFSPSYQPGRSGAEFHPGAGWLRDNGRDPAMAQGVEFSGVHDFEAEMKRMPNFALHELAHAYHFRVLSDGFDHSKIKAAYQRAKKSGLYDRVERSLGNGKPNTFERAYAMTNAMEYFAETTEAYFSRNDFFPFTREELLRHDPEMHALLENLWGVSETIAMAGDLALPGHHPLSQVQAGRLLIDELRCAACHSGVAQDNRLEKTAPDLRDVGTRVSHEFLKSYLASPSTAHPGTTMPDMLSAKSDSEKLAIVESLTHFLIAQSRPANASVTKEQVDHHLGKELFHSIGCVACHGPKDPGPETSNDSLKDENDQELDPVAAARKAIKASTVGLGHVSTKYAAKSLSEFLFQPLKVRSSGRMPDMKLTPAESLAIATYLVCHWFLK